jgi:ribose transport system substrate-binding protein
MRTVLKQGPSRRGSSVHLGLGAAVVCLVLGATAACGSDSKEGGSSSSSPKKIGVVVLAQSDEAGQRILGGLNKQAKELGWKTTVVDAQLDPSKEVAAMATFVNQGVDGIVTVFTDNELLKTSIARAKAADIPVVAIAGGDPVDGVVSNLDAPEEKSSAAMTEEVFSQLGSVSAPRIVKMVLPEAVPCKRREAGMDEVLKDHPDAKVVEYHINGANPAADAKDYTASQIQAHPETAAILSCWDIPLMGGLSGVGTDSKIVGSGVNGSSQAVQAMQGGDKRVGAIVAFGWADAGYTGIERLKNTFDKKDVPASSEVKFAVYTPSDHPDEPLLEFPDWLPKGWDADYWKSNQ